MHLNKQKSWMSERVGCLNDREEDGKMNCTEE